jgi:UMF1 family MFS transporter
MESPASEPIVDEFLGEIPHENKEITNTTNTTNKLADEKMESPVETQPSSGKQQQQQQQQQQPPKGELHRKSPPGCIRWIEKPFRSMIQLKDGTTVDEGIAWGMDSVALGFVHQAGSYVGSTIIILASKDAGCPSKDVCEKTVYGFRPSSLLPMAAIFVGIISALCMPIFGAVVDHTSHRRLSAMISALVVCMILGLQLTISLETWFFIYIIEIIGGFFMIAHTTTLLAYLPELATNEKDMSHYNSRFGVIKYIGISTYLLCVTGISRLVKAEPTTTAKVALGLALFASCILLSYSWIYLFQNRPPLSKVPEGTTLISCGFKKVGRTCQTIFTKYRSLFWFMIALLVAPDAGSGVLASIAISFMTSYLKMKPIQVGIAAISMLLCTAIGAFLSKRLSRRTNPLKSFRYSILALTLSIGFTCLMITGPDRKVIIYPCATLWGMSWGLLLTSQRLLYCTISPQGQQTEIMGLFAFANLIIGWIPALLFLFLNERGVSMRVSVFTLCIFLFFSLFFTFFIGNYDDAVVQVKQTNNKDTTSDDFSDVEE